MKDIIRHTILGFIIFGYTIPGYPQNNYIDSLKNEIRVQKTDTNRVKLLINLSNAYAFSYPDTGLMQKT